MVYISSSSYTYNHSLILYHKTRRITVIHCQKSTNFTTTVFISRHEKRYTFFPSWLSRIAGFRNEDKNG